MDRWLSITLITLACLLIAVGRHRVRTAWRDVADGRGARASRRRFFGWVLVLAGGAAMIAGVLAW
jgi:hypothetical protein